jgi:hypothetical protein
MPGSRFRLSQDLRGYVSLFVDYNLDRLMRQVTKRRRVSSYIPSDQWSSDNRPIDIVTLADMQEEYALVLSQLKLAGQDDDFHLHGMSLKSSGMSLMKRRQHDTRRGCRTTRPAWII